MEKFFESPWAWLIGYMVAMFIFAGMVVPILAETTTRAMDVLTMSEISEMTRK